MAIVKMRKLHLIAMSYDKDAVLDALQRTGAAEITLHEDVENTAPLQANGEDLRAYLAFVEAALTALCNAVENRLKESGEKSDVLKDGFDVTYSEFIAAKDQKAGIDQIVERVNALTDERNALKAELAKVMRAKQTAEIYSVLHTPFGTFKDTAHTRGRIGTVAATAKESLVQELSVQDLCSFEILNANGAEVLLFVASHKSVAEETDGILSSYGFTDCPYSNEKTGSEIYTELSEKEIALLQAIKENEATVYGMKDKIRPLKIYCDYLTFVLEKEETADKLRGTECTFWLQAYVPEPAEEEVEKEIRAATGAVFMEFSDPTEADEPPTLIQNNAVVSNFESITNAYSVPNYREFDPNTVMAIFYSIFMGFIIGDAGYGILMLLCGGILWWKGRARPTGMSRLAGAFAVGGVFAIVWGLLFNSLFGFVVLSKTVMPNPQTDMWSLAGIAVPSVLLIAMLIGVAQLFTGYVCKAVQYWRRGEIADGIFEGIVWAIFSIGVALAIVGFIDQAKLPILATVGGITAGVTLVIAMLTAGRKEKLLGKLTKGFGTAYGIINYASDILSYARLYGLMLSGAVIAQIIATYSGQFILSGNVLLAVLGVVLLIVGNAFNLVMNLLGAYIHDARLQYVEFYGRFYEGEGELFAPLGAKHKYVYLLPSAEGKKA
nr:hypothetical protein [Clostridia bacterium]